MSERRKIVLVSLICICLGAIPVCAAEPNSPQPPATKPQFDQSKAHLWALACAGVLMERNWIRHDELLTAPRTPANTASAKRLLKDSWEVKNKKDLIETLGWIEQGGHRRSFETDGRAMAAKGITFGQALDATFSRDRAKELNVVLKYYIPLGDRSLYGWDYCRYISLCRWGYTAGYLSEDEAWARIMPVAQLLQKKFSSWQQLGENYLIGRQYWGGDPDGYDICEDAVMILLESKDSPWLTLPWNTNLGDGPMSVAGGTSSGASAEGGQK